MKRLIIGLLIVLTMAIVSCEDAATEVSVDTTVVSAKVVQIDWMYAGSRVFYTDTVPSEYSNVWAVQYLSLEATFESEEIILIGDCIDNVGETEAWYLNEEVVFYKEK